MIYDCVPSFYFLSIGVLCWVFFVNTKVKLCLEIPTISLDVSECKQSELYVPVSAYKHTIFSFEASAFTSLISWYFSLNDNRSVFFFFETFGTDKVTRQEHLKYLSEDCPSQKFGLSGCLEWHGDTLAAHRNFYYPTAENRYFLFFAYGIEFCIDTLINYIYAYTLLPYNGRRNDRARREFNDNFYHTYKC